MEKHHAASHLAAVALLASGAPGACCALSSYLLIGLAAVEGLGISKMDELDERETAMVVIDLMRRGLDSWVADSADALIRNSNPEVENDS